MFHDDDTNVLIDHRKTNKTFSDYLEEIARRTARIASMLNEMGDRRSAGEYRDSAQRASIQHNWHQMRRMEINAELRRRPRRKKKQ